MNQGQKFSKSEAEFQQFYRNNLRLKAKGLEEERKKVHKRLTRKMPLLTGASILISIIMNALDADIGTQVGAFIFSFIASYSVLKTIEVKKINREMKETVMPQLVEFVNPSFIYSPNESISREAFLHSNLFAEQNIDKFSGDDFIQGYIGDTHISFSEVQALRETRDDDGNRRYINVFKGLFFEIEFNKEFHGSLYVKPKKIPFQLISNLLTNRRTNGTHEYLEEVSMENPEFKKEFIVRATDQIMARYLLTPFFMEKLLEFQKNLNHPPLFSFVDGTMYLAIETNQKHFEVEVGEAITEEKVKEYFQDVNQALKIVEELNINLHLWKQK